MIRFETKSKWVIHAALVAAGVLFLAPRPAAAQAPPASAPPAAASAAASTDIGGLVDAYYDYYSTKPTGSAPYRNFDTLHNQFAFSMAEVWLTKAPTADSRVGFKLKLNFGPATSNFIHSAEPGGSPYQNIQEAYISYLAPAGKGLQLDAGVFVTPAGAEVIEAKDNANYTHGLLFALAIPYYHSGVRATYTVNDKVTVMGGVVNGWNNIVENNSGKTVMGSVTFKPMSTVSIVENYIVGPEQGDTTDTEHRWRNLSDTVVTFAATPTVNLTANYDYARDRIGTTDVHWQGIAGYLKYQATKIIAVSPRFEVYDDANGATTGIVQKLKEVTGTLEFKPADNLILRVEYRGDWSDKTPFTDSNGKPTGNQQSIGFGAMYSFSGKIQ
jgi:hypothetical protein